MSRYFDDKGKEVICSRAEYIKEMDRRDAEAAKAKAAAEKKAAKKKGGK